MTVRKKYKVNAQRSIAREVKSDIQAQNQSALGTAKNDHKEGKAQQTRRKRKGPVPQERKVKKQREYSDKELNLPKLNRALEPAGVVRKSGKKGKIFADENAQLRIMHIVNEKIDNVESSKLERLQQLELIRKQRLQEMQHKEAEKDQKIEEKKKEMRKSKKDRKLAAKNARKSKDSDDTPKTKTVRFRV